MGDYFKDRSEEEQPKNKIEELERNLFLMSKRIEEIEQKFVSVEDYERELNSSNVRMNRIEQNLTAHNHIDGKCVIIEELGWGDENA